MSHRTAGLAALVLVASVAVADTARAQLAAGSAQPAAPAASRQADEQAIRALSQRWLAAVRARDVDAVLANFAADATVVYNGTFATGLEAIRRRQVNDFATSAKERPGLVVSWRATTVEVAQGRDMAFESGTYHETWNGGKDEERGHYLTVWRRVGGTWKVARDVAVPEATPTAAKRPAP